MKTVLVALLLTFTQADAQTWPKEITQSMYDECVTLTKNAKMKNPQASCACYVREVQKLPLDLFKDLTEQQIETLANVIAYKCKDAAALEETPWQKL